MYFEGSKLIRMILSPSSVYLLSVDVFDTGRLQSVPLSLVRSSECVDVFVFAPSRLVVTDAVYAVF